MNNIVYYFTPSDSKPYLFTVFEFDARLPTQKEFLLWALNVIWKQQIRFSLKILDYEIFENSATELNIKVDQIIKAEYYHLLNTAEKEEYKKKFNITCAHNFSIRNLSEQERRMRTYFAPKIETFPLSETYLTHESPIIRECAKML